MSQLLSNLAVGSKIRFGSIYGEKIVWIVADKDHAGYPANSVTLVTEKIIKIMAFDAVESASAERTEYKIYGRPNYRLSNIRQWLNSPAAAGKWYTAQHSVDLPPSSGDNPYSAQAGFLNGFSSDEINAIVATTIKQRTSNYETSTTESMTDKMFIPSMREFNKYLSWGNYGDEGTYLRYFVDMTKHNCGYTDKAKENAPSGFSEGWVHTRSQDYETVATMQCIYWNDITNWYGTSQPNVGKTGLRPACNVLNNLKITDNPDANGVYDFVFNEPPTIPGSISIPSQIMGGKSVAVSWSASTDVDNNLSGYQLERSLNGGTWTQIYKGANRSFTDTVPYGTLSVNYRVAAYDAYGAYSGYRSGNAVSVINNTAPTITGSDGALGTFGTTFTAQSYTVNDAQGGAVTVTERLDGVVKRSYAATLGTAASFSFTAAEWQQILNGSHTITITAVDQYGDTTVRTWTFIKAVNTLTFTITPLAADAMPTKCVVGAYGSFPASSTLKVEVCNNANDASPTWEDISAKLNKKHFFSNSAKTASAWAFGLRVTLTRGNATGDCYLDYVNINFA